MSRTVSQKMGVKEGMRAFLLNAPQSALNAMNLPELDVSCRGQKVKSLGLTSACLA